ncbi:GerAB/ArcD/ProY family transporter [Natranaerofaba carboxydovora]|uniref:GerAB/ArcD/ProY family transporter n=1 Tax=Natranaerofaba carboxydovora TaxID=2742683 RepID=UPI001F13869C|nr:GerAB/ArcD/ProY family transporter [Natranaerofaba carboxydovora]UMZ74120.1 Spore germination protein YndE [Natranaerofaba carboxydovora]
MNERISLFQTGMLLITAILPTAILTAPTKIIDGARQDSHIAVLLFTGYAFLLVLIYIPLIRRMGRTDLIKFTEKVIGKIPGKGIGLLIIIAYFFLNILIIREVSALLLISFFDMTPLWFFDLSHLAIASILVYGGLEPIARTNQFFFPFLILGFLFAALLNINEWNFLFLRPVLHEGISPLLEGALPGTIFFGEIFIILIIAPSVKKLKNVYKTLLLVVFFNGTFMLMSVLSILLLLGPDLSIELTFPFLTNSRYIGGLILLENIDVVILAVWVVGGILKIAIFYYVVAFLTSKLIPMPNYNCSIPLLFIMFFVFSHYFIDNYIHLLELIEWSTPIYFFINGGFPLILLLLSYLRRISFEEN